MIVDFMWLMLVSTVAFFLVGEQSLMVLSEI